MRLRTKVVTMVLIAVVIMLGSFSVYELSWVHVPFEVESEDGSKVFIFDPHPISPYYIRRTPSPMRMGVYYNTEPLQLIYTLDLDVASAPFGEMDLAFSECFRYMVFIPLGTWWADSAALEFYKDGVLFHTYTVSDLVRHPDALRGGWFGITWEHWDQRTFNPETNQLNITTIDGIFPFTSLPIGGRTFVFDITTGEIVARSPNMATPILGVVMLIIIVSSVRIYKKRKAHEQIRAEEKMAR